MLSFEKKIKIISKMKLLWGVALIAWGISVHPILRSSWAGDDWPNSQIPYWIKWRKGDFNFYNLLQESFYWTRGWLLGQGRFNPLAQLEGFAQFSYLRNLNQYKFFQFLLLYFCGILFVFLIWKLFNSQMLAISTLFFLGITFQIRPGFDPHIAFSSMLSSTLVKIFIACIIINQVGREAKTNKSQKKSYISALIYFGALATYEFAFMLFPLMLISYQLGKETEKIDSQKKKFFSWLDHSILLIFDKKFRPVFYAWLIYGFFVLVIMRIIAKDISGSYVLGISWKSLYVFVSQIPTGMPGTVLIFSRFKISESIFLIIALIIFCTLIYLIIREKDKIIAENNSERFLSFKIYPLITISFVMIVTPGLILSLQTSWRDIASFSNTYLGVMISEFGSALLFGTFYTLRVKSNKNKKILNK